MGYERGALRSPRTSSLERMGAAQWLNMIERQILGSHLLKEMVASMQEGSTCNAPTNNEGCADDERRIDLRGGKSNP